MPSPLEMFLRQFHSGNSVLSPEMYQHFGGDDILAQVLKFDPNAKWTDTEMGGGEGASSMAGKRLDFDITKMPNPVHSDVLNLRPSNFGSAGLKNPNYKWDDANYGNVTESKNIKRDVSGIEKYAPLIAAAIGAGGPALAGMLAAGGLGAAGLTSAVTGTGLGSVSAPSWLASLVKQGPGMLNNKKPPSFMTLAQLASKGLG